jgi:tRNA (uracil-5-)-methyltransferase
LFGEPYLYETIRNKEFRISPEAFFQVNSSAAEVLYDKTLELASLSKKTTLLDLGCGSGNFFSLMNFQ